MDIVKVHYRLLQFQFDRQQHIIDGRSLLWQQNSRTQLTSAGSKADYLASSFSRISLRYTRVYKLAFFIHHVHSRKVTVQEHKVMTPKHPFLAIF